LDLPESLKRTIKENGKEKEYEVEKSDKMLAKNIFFSKNIY